MAMGSEPAHEQGWFGTQRRDLWWIQPTLVAVGFSIFVLYSLWAAFLGADVVTTAGEEMRAYHYTGEGANYLSPFYSPCVTEMCEEGPLAGLVPNLAIAGYVLSPALFILWAPLGFRTTCYYYRKAYYRAYFLKPAACSVERDPGYQGEAKFPFILQNVHRYFLPFALALIVFLSYDAYLAFWFDGSFGVGVGTLVLTANVVLLAGYTFGCHSLRHIVGGKFDCFTCGVGPKAAHKGWRFVSWFNQRHMLWAWLSLFMVGFADLYVRLVAHGIITDVRLI